MDVRRGSEEREGERESHGGGGKESWRGRKGVMEGEGGGGKGREGEEGGGREEGGSRVERETGRKEARVGKDREVVREEMEGKGEGRREGREEGGKGGGKIDTTQHMQHIITHTHT